MKKSRSRRPGVLEVCELFAGVGGFRLGFEGYPRKESARFRTVWANQWEPGKKRQYAAQVYQSRFKDDFPNFNEDIQKVILEHFDDIPDHDILCGGFPCQDYSVARTLRQAKGLRGKKGVLWWAIDGLVERKLKREKRDPKKHRAPHFLVLENVDRLLKSPKSQRGRDFAVMLASLAMHGYAAEWRVINAADYGLSQRRRRVFIVAHHPKTDIYKRLAKCEDKSGWLLKDGLLANAFPVTEALGDTRHFSIDRGGHHEKQEILAHVSDTFNTRPDPGVSPFAEAGVMSGYEVWTSRVSPKYAGKKKVLRDVLVAAKDVPPEYVVDRADHKMWRYLKGPKSAKRVNKATGIEYTYDEGGMAFPDPVDRPSRTIVTGEGGKTPSRFKHIIPFGRGRYRRLLPVELERLNGFPDDHTKLDGITDAMRAFFMGNALVVDVVGRIGSQLIKEVARDTKRR